MPSYPTSIFTWRYIDISALLFFSRYSSLVMIYSTISFVSSSIIFNGWSTFLLRFGVVYGCEWTGFGWQWVTTVGGGDGGATAAEISVCVLVRV